jgi:hypothetical protein
MQISIIAIFAIVGLAAAAPSTSKAENYDVGVSYCSSEYSTVFQWR